VRIPVTIAAALWLAGGAAVAAPLPCSEIPAAQRFIAGLRPGPNTTLAQRHLDAAKRATSPKVCDAELRQVDRYARRSAAADARAAQHGASAPKPNASGPVPCADLLHQDRPGGSDYHGPPVAGCPSR